GEGYRDEDLKGRVYMPVGIDIGADTPEEIAVSIIAELIKIQRGGELKHLTLLS
ncbi:MAG: XdhC family protein, partial [Aigarchaeota archaeon]|nr:XdhC family protein [Aigarchaeota archaeon]